jgi:uncharacterized protein YjgD (DUF1641 family)
MARPIPLELPPRDPRTELRERLERAPVEHAEALLDAYELLQQLRDAHVFEVLHGVLSRGDKIVELAVDAAKEPDAIRGLRNLIILSKTLGSIDPKLLEGASAAVRETVETAYKPDAEPPGLFAILQQLRHKDTRRALGLMNSFLGSLGKHLSPRETRPTSE